MNHAALKRYSQDHVMACEVRWVNAHDPRIARASACTKFAHASNHLLHAWCEHEKYADALRRGGGG